MPDPSSPPPPPRRRAPGLVGWLWRPVLVLIVAGALGWWMLGLPTRSRPEPEPTPTTETAEPASPAPAPRVWRPRPRVEPAPGCAPRAARRCVEGDPWWVDGCGVTYAKATECGARLCEAGECEPPPPPDCGGLPGLGECKGEVARGCEAGHPFEVDCAARAERCVLTEEGPVCRPPSPNACDPEAERPRCEGVELVACFEGERRRVDCRTHGAICGQPPGAGAGTASAACLRLGPPVAAGDCDDACGCPPPPVEEICDGRDNDGDGWIDESGECPPVDVMVFVIADAEGEMSYAREDVDAEFARLQRYFAREDDYGIELRLVDVVRLDQPDWLELDDDELDTLVRSGAVAGRLDQLYVPLVLTERVLVDGVPRPGLSTVPNGMCGGQRRVAGPQPALGVVVLGKRRWESTGAHELGHFFGLCHTHADHPNLVLPMDPGDPDDAGDERACVEPCVVDGDGICDTPVDPGPGVCAVEPECAARCDDGSGPDPGNLMGYYPECRVGFTEQQALLMRRMIALRRGWYACSRGDGCPCEIGGPACPEAMSCRRFEGEAGPYQRCALDGPAVPGGVCSGSLDCSQGAQCIGQPDADARCVRPCTDQTPGCRCAEVSGVSHPICVDDLHRD